MKKKNFLLAAAAMMGIAGGTALGAPATAKTDSAVVTANRSATKENKPTRKIGVNPLTGGLDLPPMHVVAGSMTPKEYGQLFGTGASRKHRSNKLRYSHNAKLRRRVA